MSAPAWMDGAVAGLGIAMALLGSLLLGVAWPPRWLGRAALGVSLRGLALHLTVVPAVLTAATLVGVALPGAIWFLALGPLPTSLVSFAQLYGCSTRVAASRLAASFPVALALFPIAVALAH